MGLLQGGGREEETVTDTPHVSGWQQGGKEGRGNGVSPFLKLDTIHIVRKALHKNHGNVVHIFRVFVFPRVWDINLQEYAKKILVKKNMSTLINSSFLCSRVKKGQGWASSALFLCTTTLRLPPRF